MTWHDSHTVTFKMDKWFGVRVVFSCDEADGSQSWCRKVCGSDCPEWDSDHETSHGHSWVYRSECNVVEWLDNSEETYAGPDGVTAQSGSIEVEWQGDGYVWRLASAEDLTEANRILKESLREVVIELEIAKTR